MFHCSHNMATYNFRMLIMFLFFSATSMAYATSRPLAEVTSSSPDQLIREVCSPQSLLTCNNYDNAEPVYVAADEGAEAAGILRDRSIVTINDLQEDFFLESSLVEGRKTTVHNYLYDPAPSRAFLSPTDATTLPTLTTYNTLDIMRFYGVARDSNMATSIATAAYLCGSAALPGEARSCAASTDALAAFVAAQLGNNVRVYATKGAPTSTSTSNMKAPVTIMKVAKGSVEEGRKIVVCHHLAFPSALYYCHAVTGTKVVQATLKTEGRYHQRAHIKAMAVCHLNTELWLSRHPAFKALKIARGEEACHFLVGNDLLFTRVAPIVG
ncbi:hypothetical protein KC19_2G177900 [Ceratodon purpureus]|uniref:BURP domain-containing protein n=1 Tax=Ceratodon purpureus TaxID=3225 RepID=A0A8T0IZ08_CERPU|nr:hypothetical protein KC19_2G177800 [Ceratodon purpureus]KAG0587614.1 hypothetical protein KC19_2G177900 [Ceratodon purpureus]